MASVRMGLFLREAAVSDELFFYLFIFSWTCVAFQCDSQGTDLMI